MDVKGMAAVVTGGASGLGAGMAKVLADNGAKVALFDVNAEKGEAHAAAIGGIFCSCDVTSEESVTAALDRATAAHGEARICVNVAGINIPGLTVGRKGAYAIEKFSKVIEVNLIGSYNVARLAAARMAELEPMEDGERGFISFTSSVAAYDGQMGQTAYAASKAALAGMTLPMARDLARTGIRVMTIAPGLFATPMMFDLPQEVQDALGASVPFPSRLGTTDEYASLIMEMIRNRMLNGETIRLDGSLRLPPK
ncbi:MAG: SDR family NAD(P)-dependent oxidoreductase [Rhodospirillales bacterium]